MLNIVSIQKKYRNAIPDDRAKAKIPIPKNEDHGAGSGGRTRTVSLPPDFESGTSANSIIPAYFIKLYTI